MEVQEAQRDLEEASGSKHGYLTLFGGLLVIGLGLMAVIVVYGAGRSENSYFTNEESQNAVYPQPQPQPSSPFSLPALDPESRGPPSEQPLVRQAQPPILTPIPQKEPRDSVRGSYTFRMMSFNVRRDFESDGVNQWKFRVPLVQQMFRRENPDIIGMQEVLPEQMEDLKQMLPGFKAIGVGRDDGRSEGEFVPVFYRHEKFDAVDSGHFWLSETPDVPGSIYRGAGCTRVTTWALLRPKQTDVGVDVLALSTHLDHVSERARDRGAQVLRLMIRKILAEKATRARGTAVVVVGDFNAEPQEPAIRTLLNDVESNLPTSKMLSDSRLEALQAPDPGRNFGTFPSWNAKQTGKIIDYVLYSPTPMQCLKRNQPPRMQAGSPRMSREALECLRYILRRGAPVDMKAVTYRVGIEEAWKTTENNRPTIDLL
eukprot:CAMPEP_0114522188 /NCGR_PEP_ID=MMETSP0109-20121206/20610_1 /TAXON_ID=29199 /ORGANISM="Chlorarachnion reptans, Strain CCCM449" /LENGTH=427 /DNA_ID=CAMNT_0001703391 /DNA_START=38 /DNA_END=1322 /DNA_ORIENTATION=+